MGSGGISVSATCGKIGSEELVHMRGEDIPGRAADERAAVSFPITGFDLGSLSMRTSLFSAD
jgi:hypothetical protein